MQSHGKWATKEHLEKRSREGNVDSFRYTGKTMEAEGQDRAGWSQVACV